MTSKWISWGKYFQLPPGYYGIDSIFLLVAFMALCRIKQAEQLRYCPPGEWGKLLGLDRIPEVRTLRSKVSILSGNGQVEAWGAELCNDCAPRETLKSEGGAEASTASRPRWRIAP